MASKAQRKVVQTVKRGGAPASVSVTAHTKRNTAAKVKAKASRKAAVAPLAKKKQINTTLPAIVREEPHILKRDVDKPLAERLNPKLLEQLRTRKVTNAAAAEALGVAETYLSRVVIDAGVEKKKGVTTTHREARAKLSKARRQTREMLAKKVNRNEMTVERAAKEANCSVRTMFRYCAMYVKK